MFLGGPLYYCQGLRAAFREALKLDDKHALFPEYGRLSVALGAALYAAGQDWETDMDALLADVEESCRSMPTTAHTPPLFASEEEYRAFCERHNRATARRYTRRITAAMLSWASTAAPPPPSWC